MENTEIRRRGRPPLSLNDTSQDDAPEQAEQPVKRRRRASVGGHAMKLNAPARPGYTRHWFNDDRNRIAEAEGLAYDFVSEPGIKTDDLGSRTRHLVGTKDGGEPLYAYLMECPDELYAEGLAEKEAENQKIDEAISSGLPTEGQIAPNKEQYGQGSISRDR